MSLPSLAEVAAEHVYPGHEAFVVSPADMEEAALEAALVDIPDVPISATLYQPDKTTLPGSAELTDVEQEALEFCLRLGKLALKHGNPPVGAVLLREDTGDFWGAMTLDKTYEDLLGHAELRAYMAARPTIGIRLQDCTLVTTAQPCASTCTGPYAGGKIGRIVYAAPRPAIFAVSGLMRTRDINLPQMLRDGDTTTLAIEGHGAREALIDFAIWGALNRAGKVPS